MRAPMTGPVRDLQQQLDLTQQEVEQQRRQLAPGDDEIADRDFLELGRAQFAGAGAAGGELVYQGDVAGLRKSRTLTGRHLDDRSEEHTSEL